MTRHTSEFDRDQDGHLFMDRCDFLAPVRKGNPSKHLPDSFLLMDDTEKTREYNMSHGRDGVIVYKASDDDPIVFVMD